MATKESDAELIAGAIRELAAATRSVAEATDRVAEVNLQYRKDWLRARIEDVARLGQEREEDREFKLKIDEIAFERAVRLREMDRSINIGQALAAADAGWKER